MSAISTDGPEKDMTTLMADFDLPDAMRLRPARRPLVTGSEFRTALSGMASTVSIVTARRGNERLGRTVTSVFSLSLTPPAILVSIDMMSRLADLIAKTGSFSLAFLAIGQNGIADAFAGSLDQDRRFKLGEWQDWPSGQPRLLGAVSAFDCDVVGAMETGTHVLFAGAVVDAETTAGQEPLIWQRRQYHGLTPLG